MIYKILKATVGYLCTIFIGIPLAIITLPFWIIHELAMRPLKYYADLYEKLKILEDELKKE